GEKEELMLRPQVYEEKTNKAEKEPSDQLQRALLLEDERNEEEKHITEARKDEREQRQLLTLSNELSQPRRQEQEDPQ
ncbi:Ezrin, partial [Fukomys damarensis]